MWDGKSARCLVRCINRNYVTGCHTATFQWHLISSFYDYLPWARCGVAVANEPWSGRYEITSPTWASANVSLVVHFPPHCPSTALFGLH